MLVNHDGLRWSGDRKPVDSEFFRTSPDRPWGPPSLLYKGYRVIPGGWAAKEWQWPPTPICADVHYTVLALCLMACNTV